MQERTLAGCRRAEAKIFALEEELDLARGGSGGGGGGPALDQQALHLPRAVVGASQRKQGWPTLRKAGKALHHLRYSMINNYQWKNRAQGQFLFSFSS